MTERNVHLQPAYVLKQRQYRETSLIVDVLTRDFGILPVLAKGVRTLHSKTAAFLQVFVPLAISYLDRHELKILTAVETSPPVSELNGLALYCGYYVNELTALLLHQHDPHPEVFAAYQTCMQALSRHTVITTQPEIEAALRLFELELLAYAGYGLQLDCDAATLQPVDASKNYALNDDLGVVETLNGPFSGASLIAIAHKQLITPQILSAAKALMRIVIDKQLQGRPLKSRAVINQIIKTL